ncbi:MAG: M1 family metallopeptidase [Acidobacteriota bacterium]
MTRLCTTSRPRRRLTVPLGLVLAVSWSTVVTAGGTSAPKPTLRDKPMIERLETLVRPTLQQLNLTLDPTQTELSGSTVIDLDVPTSTAGFNLHFAGIAIDRLALVDVSTNDADAAGAHGPGAGLEAEHSRRGEMLDIVPASPLPPGRYRLEIEFRSAFSDSLQGLYRVERGGELYTFSVFQPADARRVFPCWDEPTFKIPFDLTLEVAAEHQAISTALVQETWIEEGRKIVRFERTPPLPSYGVAIATGPFVAYPVTVSTDRGSVPTRIVTAADASPPDAVVLGAVAPIVRALEDYFGRPYPYARLDLIAVPGFPSGGLENPGAPLFSESVLLLDPRTASLRQRQVQAEILAHEIAHMWFGDLVTLEWWDDAWLNESFATWISRKIVDDLFPKLDIGSAEERAVEQAFELDRHPEAPAVRPRSLGSPMEAFSVNASLVYAKGARVLRMFEHWLGEDTFQLGVRDYLEHHAWDNASADDFWRAIDRRADRPVSRAIATFIEQPGYPLIEGEIREGRLHLHQERFGAPSADAQLWTVPVAVRFSDLEGETHVFVLDKAAESFELPSGVEDDARLYPNADATGYYRWRIPPATLAALGNVAVDRLAPRERTELLANAGSLFRSGTLDIDAYLGLVGKLATDRSPTVLGAVQRAIGALEPIVLPDAEDSFAEYVRRNLAPALDRLGLEAREDDTAQLRAALFFSLGAVGNDPVVRARARQLSEAYLGGHAELGPLVQASLKLSIEDPGRFDTYWRKVQASEDRGERRALLSALAHHRGGKELRSVLEGFFTRALDLDEFFGFTAAVVSASQGSDPLFDWTRENYPRLAEALPPIALSFLPLMASGCSAERLADARNFFLHEDRYVQGVETRLAQLAGQVETCLDLRRREGAALARSLRSEPATGPN